MSLLDGENHDSVNRAFAVTDLPVSFEGLSEAGMFKVYPHLYGVLMYLGLNATVCNCLLAVMFLMRTGRSDEAIAKLSKLVIVDALTYQCSRHETG